MKIKQVKFKKDFMDMMTKRKIKIRPFLLFLILPALVIYSSIVILPIFGSMLFSFHTGPSLTPDKFIGIQNYIDLFTKYPYVGRLINALKNTIKIFLVSFFTSNLGGFVIALLVTRKFRGSTFFRRLTFIPVLIPSLITGYVFKLLLSPTTGIIDSIFRFLKIEFLTRQWLINKSINIYVVALIFTWQFIGMPILLYASGIDGINKDLLDASNIDGANELQRIRYIIMPLLIPIFRMVTILTFINVFVGFEIVYAIGGTSANPGFSLDVLGTLFYRSTFGTATVGGGWGVGMGAALATFMCLIVAVGILFITAIFKKRQEN